jgi:phage gp36-like protein
MSYATAANLRDHLGLDAYNQLTDLAGGTIGSDAVAQLRVDAAEGEVNDWLAKRYQTPIDVGVNAAVAASLRGMTLAIAAYKAYTAHPLRPTVREGVQREYEATILRLQAIADGTASLPGVDELPGPTSGGATGTAIGHSRVFTEDALEGL